MKRLVLFDIDGTLIRGGSLWIDSFVGSLKHHFPELVLQRIDFGGKTDGQICREVLIASGVGPKEAEAAVPHVIAEYLRRAREGVSTRVHEIKVLPGVRDVLEKLRGDGSICLGLLTGNVREGAELKLTGAGLREYFCVGVYADDHHDRYQLPSLAVTRAHQKFGVQFSGKQIVIIGDTIHDVNCGKSIGVTSIAVGTGHGVSREELLAHGPDHFFEDLSDTSSVVRAICGSI